MRLCGCCRQAHAPVAGASLACSLHVADPCPNLFNLPCAQPSKLRFVHQPNSVQEVSKPRALSMTVQDQLCRMPATLRPGGGACAGQADSGCLQAPRRQRRLRLSPCAAHRNNLLTALTLADSPRAGASAATSGWATRPRSASRCRPTRAPTSAPTKSTCQPVSPAVADDLFEGTDRGSSCAVCKLGLAEETAACAACRRPAGQVSGSPGGLPLCPLLIYRNPVPSTGRLLCRFVLVLHAWKAVYSY